MGRTTLSFNVQWFRDLGASFSSFGCSVFDFRELGASFRDLGASYFGLRFRVLRFRNYRTSPYFYLSCSWRNALWLNAMYCGKKCG